MRFLKYAAIAILLWLTVGCANTKFYAFGVDINDLAKAKPADYGELALGVVASTATHVAGHYIAAELADVDIHQEGMAEIIDGYETKSGVRWFARSGFLLELGVNTMLIELYPDAYFTKGYTMMSTIRYVTYNIRNTDANDFKCLDRFDGNGNFEHTLYGAWVTYNFLRLSIQEKKE